MFLSEGVSALTGPDGTVYDLFDLVFLYESRDRFLTPQRSKAVELVFYRDMTEQAAAIAMGLSLSAPVSSYANQGARQLAAVWDGSVLVAG